MKLLSGTTRTPWWFITPFVCVTCGAKWLAEKGDKVFEQRRRSAAVPPPFETSKEPTSMYMDCPECGTVTYAFKPDLPIVDPMTDELLKAMGRGR